MERAVAADAFDVRLPPSLRVARSPFVAHGTSLRQKRRRRTQELCPDPAPRSAP
jgi:hypothetical protein